MSLTDKEKRMIASPLSLSSRQKRNTKYRMRKKIQNVIQDMKFVLDNCETISKEFGIDIISNGEISKYFTTIKKNSKDISSKVKCDPDLL